MNTYKHEELFNKVVTDNYFIAKKVGSVGITKKYKGYYFLVDILDEVINSSRRIKSYSCEIYPKLARKYHENDCSIERDIRNMVSTLWDKTLKDKLYPFWGKDEKPPCRAFIRIVKDYILSDIS